MVTTLLALALAASIEPELQRCRAIEDRDQRLSCFDSAVPEKEDSGPLTEQESARVMVDQYMYAMLPDAVGVRRYVVSDPLPCANLDDWFASFSDTCICIGFKAKNRFGGYGNFEEHALPIERLADGRWSPKGLHASTRTLEASRACAAANFQDRDPKLIEQYVK